MRKVLAILLSLAIAITMIPTMVLGSEYTDMPNDWSKKALEKAVENGILTGFDGKIMPKSYLTRAQMAVVLNKAFGARDEASLNTYSDVSEKSWYYHQLAKAVRLGIISGEGNKLNPDQYVTREEIFAALAKLLKLTTTNNTVLDRYSDKSSINQWAIDGVAALVSAGYITGSDGKINPKKNISRAEFAQVMDNVLKNYIKTEGTYNKDFNGNVIINVPGVTLKNIKITGDLIIGDGVGDGEVTLDTVTVTGRTVVRGGGENSIKVTGKSNIQNIIVARINGTVRVYAEDGTSVGELIVDGSDDVVIEGTFNNLTIKSSDIVVKANNATIHSVQANGENSNIVASGSTDITKITVDAKNVTITASEGTKIGGVVANGECTNINGAGKVEKVSANANNIKVTTAGTSVSAALGTTGVTVGSSPVTAGSTSTVPGGNPGTTSGSSSQSGSGGASSGSNSSGNSGNTGNQPQTIYISGIVVTSSAISITEDKGTLQISAVIAPSNATYKSVTWSITSGSGIAVVNNTGLLSAVSNGVVTVRASAIDGSGVFGELNITITGQSAQTQTLVQARAAVDNVMYTFKPTNSTKESDIVNLSNSVITNQNISVTIHGFIKTDATSQGVGSLSFIIKLTNSVDSTIEIISVRKDIAMLQPNPSPKVLTVSSNPVGATFMLQVDGKEPVPFTDTITLPAEGENFTIYSTPVRGKSFVNFQCSGLGLTKSFRGKDRDEFKFANSGISSSTPSVVFNYVNTPDINNSIVTSKPGVVGTKSLNVQINVRDAQNKPISGIRAEDIQLCIKDSSNNPVWVVLAMFMLNEDGVVASNIVTNGQLGIVNFTLQFTTTNIIDSNKFTHINDGSTINFDVEIVGVVISGLEAQLSLADNSAVALAKISAYADSQSNLAPDVSDYTAAGITGVTYANIGKVNTAVAASTREQTDTVQELQAIVTAAIASNTITFESAYGDNLVVNKNILSIGVESTLTEDMDFSKIKYATSDSAENSIGLTGTYTKVSNSSSSSPLPGTYHYFTYSNRTIVYIGLTAEDAASIKGLTGFGNDDNYGNANSDRLIAEDGWYPGATGGGKLLKLNYFFTAINNSSNEIINLYEYDNTSWIGGFGKRDPGWCNGDEIGGEIYFYTDKIVLYSGPYCEGLPTSGYMKIITITEDNIENVNIDDTGWIEINGSNFGNP